MVTMISHGVTIGTQILSTIILSRLLSPADFGILAMVLAVTAFAGLFRDLGLSTAAIQKQDLTDSQQSALFWINIAMGLVLGLIVAALSPLVASFYGRPEVRNVTLVLSLVFVLGSLGAQHRARLTREMSFGKIGAANILGQLVSLMVAVTLAMQGAGYWALVWGNLLAAGSTSAALFFLSPFRPSLPSRGSDIRQLVGFGAHITGFEIVNYFHRNLDNMLLGRFWGAEVLGHYSRAYQLLMLPIHALRTPINTVAFPAMSQLRADPEGFRIYYRRVSSMLAILSMPLTSFCFLAAEPIIVLALGEQWIGVAPVFSILAISGFIQPVASLRGLVLLSTGQSKLYLKWGVINAVCVSVGFVIGVRWGGVGLAVSYAIVNYAILYPSLKLTFKNSSVAPRDFFSSIARPSAASIIAGAIAYVAMSILSATTEVEHLLISSGIFALVWIITYLALPGGKQELEQLIALVGQISSRAEK